MTDIKSALSDATLQLAQHDSARIDAEILLAFVLNKNRTFLYTYPQQTLTDLQILHFQQLLTQRSEGIPIAYLIKTKEFWSLPLYVNSHTLIPRPETELLVELALLFLQDKQQAHVLDLGTGSGAVALALAHEKPHWQILATDQSIDTLNTAKMNANQLNIRNIEFFLSDWFEGLPNRTYDAIVSNPPYIKANDPHLQMSDVRFEPYKALVGGIDGLSALRNIIEHSYHRLLPGGFLLVEHGYDQKKEVSAIFENHGYCQIQSWSDHQGNDRVTGGWRKVEIVTA